MNYTIHAGDNSTDLGKIGDAATLSGAKKLGRKAVATMLPGGLGSYTVRDELHRDVLKGERSIRTSHDWVEQ